MISHPTELKAAKPVVPTGTVMGSLGVSGENAPPDRVNANPARKSMTVSPGLGFWGSVTVSPAATIVTLVSSGEHV